MSSSPIAALPIRLALITFFAIVTIVMVPAAVLAQGSEGTEAESNAASGNAIASELSPDPPVEPDEPAPAAETTPPRTRVIEEIVVTATKREESVRDIAGSVTALTGQQLEDDGLDDIRDVVDAVPGVNLIENSVISGVQRVTIRGISALGNQNDTVGVFIDETPFTDVFFAFVTADANPFDMSSVEVLKGPVGTLFGGSALNGAIRYIPQKPEFGQWQTKLFSQYSTNSESEDIGRISGAAVNIPILDSLALRVTAIDRESEGWIDSLNQVYMAKDVNKVSQRSARAILRWQPLDPLDLSLMVLDQDTLIHDVSYADACCGGGYERTAAPQPLPSSTSYQTWQLKGTWAFGWADLVLVASDSDKQHRSLNDLSYLAESDPPNSAAIATVSSDGQPRSQELRMVFTPDGSLDGLVGLFNYKYRVDAGQDILTGSDFGGAQAVPITIDADVTEKALFGEVRWRFGGQFELTGGLRFYEFAYLGEFATEGASCFLGDPTCPTTGFRGVLELDEKESGVSPKLSLKWDITDDAVSYISAARGFRFGGVNSPAGYRTDIPPVYGSDSLWSYELGVRAQWLNDSLITDATVFTIDWTDAQYNTTTPDGAAAYTDNVGAVKGTGLEGQLIWLTPLSGVSLSLTPAYAKIETAEDYTAPSSTGMGSTTPAGTPWPRAPKWQTAASLGWDGQLGERELSAALTHRYFGKARQGNVGQGTQIFGYSSYDFQVTVKKADEGWWPDLVVNLNNLTNTRATTYSGTQSTPNGGSPRAYTVPRSLSVRLSLDF